MAINKNGINLTDPKTKVNINVSSSYILISWISFTNNLLVYLKIQIKKLASKSERKNDS